MREKRPVNVYKDGEYIKSFDMLCKAAAYTTKSVTCIRYVLEKNKPTKEGWYFSDEKLTQQELDKIFSGVTKTKLSMIQKIKSDETTDLDFYLPPSKNERKQMLVQYIVNHLGDYFMRLPMKRTSMEKRFLRRLIESL